jgi:hypothetical protein
MYVKKNPSNQLGLFEKIGIIVVARMLWKSLLAKNRK